ncbi:MAG: NAD(P)H-quinone oxidoreductase subunit O [Acaryochloridaceae cyanobacterium CSU_3_4]|nr:NAD(P)H-quinone oxidoreductase subunit O [Acaryochloridaceae cyanobacterium CSU_3_4]
MAVKKGSMVRIVADKFANSLEAKASDPRLPPYVFEGTGEVVEVKGEYAQIKFRVPAPTVWLRVDQLEASNKSNK